MCKLHKRLYEGLAPLSIGKDNSLGEEWVLAKLSKPHTETCMCGKTGLVHNYQIKNLYTDEEVLVGSECIKSFKDDKMTTAVKAVEWVAKDNGSAIPEVVLRAAVDDWKVVPKKHIGMMFSIRLKRFPSDKQAYWLDYYEKAIKNYVKKNYMSKQD